MVALSHDPALIRIHKSEFTPDYVPDPSGATNTDGSPKLIKNMAADVHAMTCELMWGHLRVTCWNAKTTPFPGLPGKCYRDIAKTIVFGLAYGKSAAGLANDWGIEEDAAQKIIDDFFKPYPVLKRWLEEQGNRADATRISIYGVEEAGIVRWRMVNSGHHTDRGALKRMGMNTPIQGASALMMKKALVLLLPLIVAAGGEICGTIHDEVLVRFPLACKAAVLDAIDKGMMGGCEFFLRGIVDAKYGVGVGPSWTKD